MYQLVDVKSPLSVNYEVTKVCNLRCNMCFAYDCEMPKHPSLATVFSILEALAKAEVFQICLFGGEFFTYPHWRDVIVKARRLGFFLTFISNGTLITDDVAEFLRSYGIKSGTISIQGLERTHDEITRIPGSFKKSVNGLRSCLSAGLDMTVLTTLKKENFGQIFDLISYLDSVGLIDPMHFAYGINRLAPFGLAREEWEKKRLSFEQYMSVLPDLERIEKEFNLAVSFADAFPLCLVEEKYHKYIQGCWQFTGFGHISSDGNVRGCAVAQGSLGNLLGETLEHIWNCPTVKTFRKQEWLPSICKECKWACGAGCTASSVCEDLYAPDEFLFEKGLVK